MSKLKNWFSKKEVQQEGLTLALLLLAVFVFRSVVAEPYVVPTGSLKPVVWPGDRIFVFKSAYDIKFPFTDYSLYKVAEPKRGDIIVFRYPLDESINYVKRLIGLPGDEVDVVDGHISINGKPLETFAASEKQSIELDSGDLGATFFYEKIGDVIHPVQRLPYYVPPSHVVVPEGHYFFVGDNREGSKDSRSWGFVPKVNLKGKALAIWLSLDTSQGWIPKIRWDRIGNSLTH